MKIAVEGCAHGELEKIYDVITHLEQENNIKVDLLLICGDFQSVRNETDLECMAVPVCYRHMQSFYKYYSGEKTAPILTIFVGGNHEASNYLSELNYGGWVCPNIYYLGKAGVVNVGGLRIAGLSGIYNGNSYLKGVYEIPPYDKSSLRTVYHVRNLEVYRLGLLKEPLDVMLSHDWPRGIYNHGDCKQLLRKKPFFKDEIANGSLGSPPAEKLLNTLKPKYWFAAHLHCKFAALVDHKDGQSTKFLALDKCLPHRKFLQIVDIETSTSPPFKISYDLEWLAILRETDSLLNFTKNYTILPDSNTFNHFFLEISTKCKEILQILKNTELIPKSVDDLEDLAGNSNIQNTTLDISTHFKISTPPFTGTKTKKCNIPPPFLSPNVQTTKLCQALDITDPAEKLIEIYQDDSHSRLTISSFFGMDEPQTDLEYLEGSSKNPDEIDIESDEAADEIKTSSFVHNEDKDKTEDLNSDNDVSPEGDFKLFVIDRKPSTSTPSFKRMSMFLPDPIHTQDDESTGGDVSTGTTALDESDTSVKRMCGENHSPVPVSLSSSSEQSTPLGKIPFKRRNQSIYATKKSDDES